MATNCQSVVNHTWTSKGFALSLNRGSMDMMRGMLITLLCLMATLIVAHMISINLVFFHQQPRREVRSGSSDLMEVSLVETAEASSESSDVDLIVVETVQTLLEPNCSHVTSSDEQMELAIRTSDRSVYNRLENCSNYFRIMPIAALKDVESNEQRAKLAFSHQVHKEIFLLEALLAVMFRPWNVHCIHVDRKASETVHKTVHALAQCYNERFASPDPNSKPIHVMENPEAVFWGHISVLKADLRCLEHLLVHSNTWTRFVNLAGTELPIREYAYFEKVLLEAPLEANMLESYPLPQEFQFRVQIYHQLMRIGAHKYDMKMMRDRFNTPPPPFGLKIFKGMKNVILSRSFSHYVLTNAVANKLYIWLEDVSVPDEFFFQTLATITHCSSTHCNQNFNLNTSRHGMPRFTVWKDGSNDTCHGKWIRDLCNFAMQDLPKLDHTQALIVNKFNLEVDSKAPLCHFKALRENHEILI